MRLTAIEARWARAAMEAFAPGPGREVNHLAVLERIMRASTRKAALGMRLAVWLVALAPLWALGRLRTIVGESVETRARLLSGLLVHRAFLVRELALLLKIGASFALLGDPRLRERSGYDGRPRLPLPVLHEESA